MKRIVFITHNNQDNNDGVWKKIASQVQAMRNSGASVDFFYMKDNVVCYNDGHITKKIINRYKNKYFFYSSISSFLIKQNKKYDLAYLRKPHGGLFVLFFNKLISTLKKHNTYIIVEVPTFPYNKEMNTFKSFISNCIFELSLPFFKNKITEIYYMGDKTESIWGVKAKRISNGIDVKTVKHVDEKNRSDNNFNIVGVANIEFWHGYDRIISGLKEYKGDFKVIFHIVGYSQPEYNRLLNMSHEMGLSDKVIFHGRKSGDELDTIIGNADICVDALGRHRSGNNTNSSIKSKEYAARGMPFVKSHEDYAFCNEEFILEVLPDDSPIDIDSLINWRRNLKEGFSLRERTFAENNLSWEKQFSFLKEE